MKHEENPKLFVTSYGSFVCPVCDREWTPSGRGTGFVKAGARRHVFACWEKTVVSRGLTLGRWIEGQGYQLIPKRGVSE